MRSPQESGRVRASASYYHPGMKNQPRRCRGEKREGTRRLAVLFFILAAPLLSKTNRGELRLKVTDPSGIGVKATAEVVSEANHYHETLTTGKRGELDIEELPYGVYQLEITATGFAVASTTIEIRSSLPTERVIQLVLSSVTQSVTVRGAGTLLDPDWPGSASQIGSGQIRDRVSSLPGRSLQDLVNSQPGWLYEGNAVLHPRGSEYQTQFVVDGIPLTDNRSPSFGPDIGADDVESLTVYTAGIPAGYGRKMGGVVEVNTLQDSQAGFHGQAVLSGGSYASAGAFGEGQYVWGRNTFGASASGGMTDHYLNPVVPQNYSNTGTLGDWSARYERDLPSKDRLSFVVRHEIARYDIPNEYVQQSAGQRQTGDNIETMGIVSYQHTFSPNVLADLHGMVRDNASDFNSSPNSTPIEVFQHDRFREGYFKGTLTVDHGRQEWKFGAESDNTFLHENFSDAITDPSQFDSGVPSAFSFAGNRPDLEQSAFAEDLVHLGDWTLSAGIRWDHYQLLLNRQAVSPRLSISRYFPSQSAILHFSYDRVFQTPSFENILLSSSTSIQSFDPQSFFRLPVEPSMGNYYEAGITKALRGNLRLDANYFRRDMNNYADDDQIENTSISMPISFRKAIIYGAEAKLDVPDWHRFSGFLSYSYEVGNAWLPVTGGLFFGDDATSAETELTGHFPDSQDQRNTVRGRARFQATSRFWIAAGIQSDSGLPFEFDGDPETVLAEYGQDILNRINFARGRIDPAFQVNASAGAELYKSDHLNTWLQVDGQNLTNVLNVIDFGGLFSGNAIGPARSFALRLTTKF